MKKAVAIMMTFFCTNFFATFGVDKVDKLDDLEKTLLPIAKKWKDLDDAQSCLMPAWNVTKSCCVYGAAAFGIFSCLPDSVSVGAFYGVGIFSGCFFKDVKSECFDNRKKAYQDQQVLAGFISKKYSRLELSSIGRFGGLSLADSVALRSLSSGIQDVQAPCANRMK